MHMNMIVAVEKNWGIGKDNDLLFHLPPDMKHFREKTLGHVVVMGDATLKSLPGSKGLPGRTNIVLTDHPGFECENGRICTRMDELFDLLKAEYADEEIFVIGGASVYNQLMDCCTTAYVTQVDKAIDHDVAIQPIQGREGWELVEQSPVQEHNGYRFTFNEYRNHGVSKCPNQRD